MTIYFAKLFATHLVRTQKLIGQVVLIGLSLTLTTCGRNLSAPTSSPPAPTPSVTEEPVMPAPLPSPTATSPPTNTPPPTPTATPVVTEAAPLPPNKPQLIEGILVTHDDGTMPAGCQPHQVAHIIQRFIDALNEGDRAALRSFFDDDFMWYVVAELNIQDRADLMSYFAQRFAQQEQMTLIMMDVDYEPGRRLVHVGYKLLVEAADLEGINGRPLIVYGKGSLKCEAGEGIIVVWSMGPPLAEEPEDPLQFCPAPSGDLAALDVPVVCTRGWSAH